MPENLLSTTQAAAVLGVRPRTVQKLRQFGQIAAIKVGDRTLYEPAELARFIEAHRDAPGGDTA